jgi:hypothetical protein
MANLLAFLYRVGFMVHLKKIKITDALLFKNATMSLDFKGITFITGKNNNSNVLRRNGTGKSLLTTMISGIAFQEPVPQGKKKNHYMLGGSIEWTYTFNKDLFVVTKGKKGYSILKNSKDLSPRTIAIAESLIHDTFLLNDTIFYTTVYLDSRRANPLVSGTPAIRLHYLMDLFGFSVSRKLTTFG